MIISLDFPYCLQRIFLSGGINLVSSILFLEDKVLSKRAVTTNYSLYNCITLYVVYWKERLKQKILCLLPLALDLSPRLQSQFFVTLHPKFHHVFSSPFFPKVYDMNLVRITFAPRLPSFLFVPPASIVFALATSSSYERRKPTYTSCENGSRASF